MLKIMVVAGSNTDTLSSYLRDRGSIEVSNSYNSLYKNFSNISNSIIKVDRLVYVYQESKLISIKEEMGCLKKLLTDNSFFTVKEIYFFCDKKSSEIASPYFRSVMLDCNISNYTLSSDNDSIPFIKIYDTLIGTNDVIRQQTKYKNVYRVEKGFESKFSYEEDEDNFFCEPFIEDDLKHLVNYNKSVIKNDNGYLNIDNKEANSGIYQNPDLDEFSSKLTRNKNTVIVTGNRYSGKTTYACSLAVSSSKAGKKVLLIDMCNNINNCFHTLFDSKVEINTVSFIDVISGNIKSSGDVNVLRSDSLKDFEHRFDMLQYYYNNISSEFDIIIIDCRSEDFLKSSVIVNSMLYRCLICCCAEISQIDEVKDYIILSDKFSNLIMLSNNMNINNKKLSPKEVKEELNNEVKVVAPISIDSIDLESDLYYSLMEVI